MPTLCVQFLLSLMDNCNEAEAEGIDQLLFDYLLINYPKKVSTLMISEAVHHENKTKVMVNDAIARLNEYLEGMRGAEIFPELLPTLSNREISARFQHQEMTKVFREVDRDSILNLFAKKTVMLYGRSSVSYYTRRDGYHERKEMKLNSLPKSLGNA